MIRLSVNINKVALLRNSRGNELPNLVQVAKDCEAFGAQGITIHPRPDERHIRYSDIGPLKEVVTTELNIEGYPNEKFIAMVRNVRPHQVTLVPDPPGVLTSSEGWNAKEQIDFLRPIIEDFRQLGIRTSLFLDADESQVEGAAQIGADRIELYTGTYAKEYVLNTDNQTSAHIKAANKAMQLGLGVNAGHDLNLSNLAHYAQNVPGLQEVSIGHALICDALYYGLKNAIGMYLNKLT